MTLYRKYRPQTLSDVLGQEPITEVLSQAIKTRRLAPAYLFAGPRGTGKTSVARILARAVNCLHQDGNVPCNHCDSCQAIAADAYLDVIELDAASNRGIDEIRALKEQVAVAPAMGGFKVYILDEAHMLTNEAFNALLKTLEEPPAKVIFILCTTEAHKIPVTIASRCQRFVFNRATVAQAAQQLQQIAAAEKINIEPSAIDLLAQLADGGYRDAAMLLEQVASAQPNQLLTAIAIEQHLGLASQALVKQLVESIIDQQPESIVITIEQFIHQGGSIKYLADSLTDAYQQLLFALTAPRALQASLSSEQQQWLMAQAPKTSLSQALAVAHRLIQAKTHLTALSLELALLEAIQSQEPHAKGHEKIAFVSQAPAAGPPSAKVAESKPDQTAPAPEKKSAKTAVEVKVTVDAVNLQHLPEEEISEDQAESSPANQTQAQSLDTSATTPAPADIAQLWGQILDGIRPKSRSVEALLRDCLPLSFDGKIITLQFWYEFHKKQLDQDKNRRLVEEVATVIVGGPVSIRSKLGDKSQRPAKKPMGEADLKNLAPVAVEPSLVEAAAEIFGGEFIEPKN